MSPTNFQNLTFRTLKKSSPKTKQDQKFSFTELAAIQDRHALARSTDEKSKTSSNSNNRKDLYDEACIYLNQVLNAVKNRQSFALDPGFQILDKIAEFDHRQDELFIMSIHLDDRLKFVVHHSVNVAIYALKMAEDLGFSKKHKLEVAMAALLHDVGMADIPDKITYKHEKLSQQEEKILRESPNHSCEILRSFGDGFGYLAESAAQVYERVDGTGYPMALKGEEIHEYAQIIGILDMYEALIHSRPYRERLTYFTAVKEIINTCKNQFQRKHLKSLLSIFTAFPIYSFVRLNSNAIGKVIETYPQQPMRPKLQIIFDSQRRKVLTKRIIVLPDNPLLNIVDSVSESEIQELSQSQPV
ncbi:MAG: HD domain-containing protein [Desulfobacterales bacterium]|nr:HD domain-containing protein [Desulfobacterales bacterium]